MVTRNARYGECVISMCSSASCAGPPPSVIAGVFEAPVRLGVGLSVVVVEAASIGCSVIDALRCAMLRLLSALALLTKASMTANKRTAAPKQIRSAGLPQ